MACDNWAMDAAGSRQSLRRSEPPADWTAAARCSTHLGRLKPYNAQSLTRMTTRARQLPSMINGHSDDELLQRSVNRLPLQRSQHNCPVPALNYFARILHLDVRRPTGAITDSRNRAGMPHPQN